MSETANVWQGTLALMILKTLETLGSLHGWVLVDLASPTATVGTSAGTADFCSAGFASAFFVTITSSARRFASVRIWE